MTTAERKQNPVIGLCSCSQWHSHCDSTSHTIGRRFCSVRTVFQGSKPTFYVICVDAGELRSGFCRWKFPHNRIGWLLSNSISLIGCNIYLPPMVTPGTAGGYKIPPVLINQQLLFYPGKAGGDLLSMCRFLAAMHSQTAGTHQVRGFPIWLGVPFELNDDRYCWWTWQTLEPIHGYPTISKVFNPSQVNIFWISIWHLQ